MTDRITEIRERAEARRAVSSRAIIDEHSEDADIFYLLDQIAERDAKIARLQSAADSADMSGAAIMVCRKMLKDELGIHHAFFDDCVAHAIAMVKEDKAGD